MARSAIRTVARQSLRWFAAAHAAAGLVLASDFRPATAPFYDPPQCGFTAPFDDVDTADPFCPWIRQLKLDGISVGCGGGNYCPKNPVTREQLAMMLERTLKDGPATPTVFSRFGGSGLSSRVISSGGESLGSVKAEYSSFTVSSGATLFIDQGAGYIAADYCVVDGTIIVTPGGLGNFGASSPGTGNGFGGANGAGGAASPTAVPDCLGGQGGNGGPAGGFSGGLGGGAAGHPNAKAAAAAVGFPGYLLCGGGGGGSGAAGAGSGGSGGGGGGVFYLECNILFFSGEIQARGSSGAPGGIDMGAGGGGGGGVVILRTRDPQLTSGTINVSGGLDGGVMNNGTIGAPGYSALEVVP